MRSTPKESRVVKKMMIAGLSEGSCCTAWECSNEIKLMTTVIQRAQNKMEPNHMQVCPIRAIKHISLYMNRVIFFQEGTLATVP